MIRAAVVGASGYTGAELLRILAGHAEVEITCVTSRQSAGEKISSVFPSLTNRVDLICDPLDRDVICSKADFIFVALPHKSAMEIVPELLEAGKKVVDLSADYRLKKSEVYEAWYQPHSSPQLLGEAVYGLPEIYRDRIPQARLVANPGCYPTSIILGMAPLLKAGVIHPESLIVDSKSGTSGAGRSLKQGSLFCEVNESFRAYGIGQHRHTPEIEQVLGDLAGRELMISFTPHLLPVNRGILSTCYATLVEKISTGELLEIFRKFYHNESFVRIFPEGLFPDVAFVRGANFCDIGLTADPRTERVIVVSAIDNLVKGAAGQAVQNMNLMMGLSESEGLGALPVFP